MGNRFEKVAKIFKNKNVTALLVCIAGIILNLVLSAIVGVLDLPLYMDTVGTVIVAAMGGALPGVLVGFCTNMIKSISDPSALYYGVLNMLIALFAAYISYRGRFKKVNGIIDSILIFTIIGGGLGSLIPLYMEGLSFDSESLSASLFQTGHFSVTASHVLSSIIMDFPDKIIVVLIAVVVLRFVPEEFYDRCGFNMWLQNADSIAYMGRSQDKSKKTRRLSLRTKAALGLSLSLSIIAALAMIIGMSVFKKTLLRERTELAQGVAEISAHIIDGDSVYNYLMEGEEADGYAYTEGLLEDMLKTAPNIAYLYVYKIEEDGCHVVFDIDTEDMPGAEPGTIVPFDDSFKEYVPKLLRGEEIDPIVSNDTYGSLLTVYYPVHNSYGNTVCYVGVDVDMGRVEDDEHSFIMEMISIFFNFFILICTFVIWLIDYHVIFPVKAITDVVDDFSETSDSQEKMDEDVKRFRSLDIHTGDEIEKLYNSLEIMTLKQTEQMRRIRRLSESTTKMQDGLIITMADMVENRDSDTGAHVQKTAAYVKIIAEGLEKKGYYAEKITPKFLSDVVRSAPLHDVGKINISDKVLNKPGKLTDEEYEIMKTHTTAGRQIIERAISITEGDNYLKEARNMAAYHHERWDGKGYPEGLHGEVIPLSARIMAVADVFDALTSPRVYKPAFPVEKALSIIEEGKGTQFDPKCVEVFMDSLEEVEIILQKYNRQV